MTYIWNVTYMGPVKPDLPVQTLTLILTNIYLEYLLEITYKSNLKLWSSIFKLETSVFSLQNWNFGDHGLLLSIYPSVACPVILQPEEPAPDLVIGLPSSGALENPPGLLRTLSLVAVTGEPGPGSGPNTSGASSNIWYDCSSRASSTSIGCCSTLSTAEANSGSDWAYQSSLMFVTSCMPNSSSIDCSVLTGVSYLVASCSSGVFRLIRVNPGAHCGSKWALFHQCVLTVNPANDGGPPDANPPETSTPIKTTPESGKCHSKRKLNISKIRSTHLLFDMRDQQEKARRSVGLIRNVRFRRGAPTWNSSDIAWLARERWGAYRTHRPTIGGFQAE